MKFDIFGWFKNDLKDLVGQDRTSDKELDSIAKKYANGNRDRREKINDKLHETIDGAKETVQNAKDKMESLSSQLEEVGEDRKKDREVQEEYGSTTTDDIANARRKKLFNNIWKFAGITFLGIILTALFITITTGPSQPKQVTKKIRILEGFETEDADYSMSVVSAQVAALATQINEMKEEGLKKDEKQKEELLASESKNRALNEQLLVLKKEMEEASEKRDSSDIAEMINSKFSELEEKISSSKRPTPSDASHMIMPLPEPKVDTSSILVTRPVKAVELQQAKVTISPKVVARNKQQLKAVHKEYEYSDIKIDVLTSNKSLYNNVKDKDKKKKPSMHVMTGFAKATLITGVDAPTFGAGQANPVPVILSLNSEELIANGFDANLKDCMLIGQAFGNMNTMRAEIEVTRMSCNIMRKGILYKVEESVKAWVYGENGIHGVKGRLVDSAGKILTKELAVGFLQGVATAFAQPQTQLTTLGGSPAQMFERGSVKDATYRGAGQGTANALNSLSEYYTKLLDGAYPFISVRSGRNVTVMFKGGEDIKMSAYTRIDVDSDSDIYDEYESMEIDKDGW